MEAYSQHYIRQNSKDENPVVLIVQDKNPEGVTITIKDNKPGGTMTSFNMPRRDMIEALEYVLAKLKTTMEQ